MFDILYNKEEEKPKPKPKVKPPVPKTRITSEDFEDTKSKKQK